MGGCRAVPGPPAAKAVNTGRKSSRASASKTRAGNDLQPAARLARHGFCTRHGGPCEAQGCRANPPGGSPSSSSWSRAPAAPRSPPGYLPRWVLQGCSHGGNQAEGDSDSESQAKASQRYPPLGRRARVCLPCFHGDSRACPVGASKPRAGSDPRNQVLQPGLIAQNNLCPPARRQLSPGSP